MKCPEHRKDMRKIDETVNAYDGTDVFWICDGEGRFPRKHIVMTQEWGWGDDISYFLARWEIVKIKERL